MRLPYFAAALAAVSLLSFAAAACSSQAPQAKASPSADPDFEPPPPVESNALPDDAAPSAAAASSAADAALVPEAEKGETGARGVLLTWARAIEFRRYGEAWRQWGDGGQRSGLSEAQYAAQFAPYAKVTIGFGDGEVEGAAGSLYYEVPVDFSGQRKDGGTAKSSGKIVVRRVNDVDGATPAQLRWHIDSTSLQF